MTKAADILSIHQLCAAYSEAASRLDPDAAAAVFAEDGILSGFAAMVGKEGDTVGRSSIASLFREVFGTIEFIHQLTQPALTELNGDRATGRTLIHENMRFAGAPRLIVFLGHSDEEFVRTAEGWRISHRRLVPKAIIQSSAELTRFG